MAGAITKYGFAAVVVGGLAAMTAVVALRGAAGAGGGAAAPGGQPGRPAEAPRVLAGTIGVATFSDSLRATGTAQAAESIEISSKVTDVIAAIRFDSGQRVTRGQVLVEISAVEQRAALAEAEAQEEVAKRELERFQELAERGFTPRSRLESAQATYDRAVAQVAANRARLADRTIRAPFSGVVGLRNASPGQLARPGDVLGTLDDVSAIKLDFDVPEADLARLRPGTEISAQSAAYPGATFTGRIAQVDSRVSEATRTVRVRALLPNQDGRLRPGMLMSVLVLANQRTVLAAPESATVELEGGAQVFRLTEQEGRLVVTPARIRTGQRLNGMVEVLEGLSVGDRIVVEGVQRVRPGQVVRAEERAGPAQGGPAPAAEGPRPRAVGAADAPPRG